MSRLTRKAQASGTDWALGIEARSRALMSEGDAAQAGFDQAIGHLSRTRVRAELARTYLLYGEWLRRANRRVDARGELNVAYDMFGPMGMEAFAERARQELLATGATVHKRSLERFFDELSTPIDHVLVTGPGPYYAPLEEFDLEEARRDADAHLWLPLHVARNAMGKVRPGGTLVFIGGAGGRRPVTGLALIGPIVAALPALTKYLALELDAAQHLAAG